MRAVFFESFGDIEVLQVGEVPEPKIGPDTVVVKTRASSVNPVDWKIMKGYLDSRMDTVFPVVPGWDLAGVVEAVGASVEEFTEGDEVFGYARMDYVHHGTFATYCAVPVRVLSRKPSALSFEEAGVMPLAGLTAYQGLVHHLKVSTGETVLISGGAGGVGVFAIQIARTLGAKVLATCSSSNFDFVRSLGAVPIPYGEGFDEVLGEEMGKGLDAFFDLYGGDGLAAGRAHLVDKTRVASVADTTLRDSGGHYIFVRPSKEDLDELSRLATQGELQVRVEHNFELEQIPEAFQLSMGGHVRGKLAISIA